MKAYLDSLDSFYSLKEEPKEKTKPKTDSAGIGAIIFTFTVMSIVIGLIYTAWQIAYGQNSSSMVDKLIQDTQKGELYRTELIKGNIKLK